MNESFTLDYIESFTSVKGIVHIGAHEAEELLDYEGLPTIWVEAHPVYAKRMLKRVSKYANQIGLQALLSCTDGSMVDFYITKDEVASSTFKPKIHQEIHAHAPLVDVIKLKTKRFDTLIDENSIQLDLYNLLVLDVQGGELNVLNGFGKYIHHFPVIVTEYSTDEFYENAPRLEDIESYLSDYRRVYPKHGKELLHGDALFLRGS